MADFLTKWLGYTTAFALMLTIGGLVLGGLALAADEHNPWWLLLTLAGVLICTAIMASNEGGPR